MGESDPNSRLGLMVFERAPCFVAILAPDFQVTRANAAFHRAFGEREGDFCYAIYKGRDRPCSHCVTRQVLHDGVSRLSQEEGVDRNGTLVSYQVEVLPICNERGEVEQVLHMSLDTTRTHDLEKGLKQAERLASVGLTTAGLAHTIKNILAGLDGGVYVVNSGFTKHSAERVEAGWKMVQKYLEQVSALVRNLLRYARASRPARTEVAPEALVAEVIQLYESKAALVGIGLEARVAAELPVLRVDREAIAASLTNLVSNSIDACTWDPDLDKPHRIVVSAALVLVDGAAEPDPGWVRFEVADNGLGIAPGDQHKILQAFFTTKGMSGTGLGLLLTKKAVEEHGGRISFTSTHGQGAAFRIDLPVVAPPEEAKGNDGEAEPRGLVGE